MPDPLNTAAQAPEEESGQTQAAEQPQRRERRPETPAAEPEKIAQETKEQVATVTHVLEPEFDKAQSYKGRLAVLQKMHPPIDPQVCMNLLFKVKGDHEKGLVFEILGKVESAISPEQTQKDGKCIFETVLKTPDVQLAFVKKLHYDGMAAHIVPLLKHAKSDDVRLALLNPALMREQFASEDDLFEAMKTAKSWEVMSKILDRVPQGGLSAEMVEKIKQSPEINAGLLGNIFKKLKVAGQSQESFKKSGPEKIAETAASPFKRLFGWVGGLWSRFKNGVKGFFGIKTGEAPVLPAEQQQQTPPEMPKEMPKEK